MTYEILSAFSNCRTTLQLWSGDEHGHHLLDMKRFVSLHNILHSEEVGHSLTSLMATLVEECKNIAIVSFVDDLYCLLKLFISWWGH